MYINEFKRNSHDFPVTMSSEPGLTFILEVRLIKKNIREKLVYVYVNLYT